jgi:hypothetical protein
VICPGLRYTQPQPIPISHHLLYFAPSIVRLRRERLVHLWIVNQCDIMKRFGRRASANYLAAPGLLPQAESLLRDVGVGDAVWYSITPYYYPLSRRR